MAFEHPFEDHLTGTLTATVQDPSGIHPPAAIIQHEDAWNILVDWSVDGEFAPFLGGDWHVKVFVESIGPGYEGQVGSTLDVAVDTAPADASPRPYSATVEVAAGMLDPGTYKVVTLLNYDNGGVPGEMAAFHEGPVIQIYEH